MSLTTMRPYKVTFILDTRGYDQPVETLVDFLKETCEGLGAEVTGSKDHGIRDFARTPDQRFTSGSYIELRLNAPVGISAGLNEKLRLDRRVHRILVESA